MKKLLATVCTAALLLVAGPAEAPAMPFMHGALKGNTVIGSAAATYKGAFSTVASQSSFSWNTVDLGTETGDRKVGLFITTRVAAGSVNISSVTIAGQTAYEVTEQTSILNRIAFWVADVPTGSTNQTITVNLSGDAAQCSIIVYSLYSVGILAPIDFASGTTDNVAINSYVHAKGALICGLVCQSAAGVTAWTNATEDVDAVYTGSTVHSAASFVSAAEVAARAVTADVSVGAVSDFARINVSFAPYSPKPFVYQTFNNQVNAAGLTTYTFSNVPIGIPTADRRVLVYAGARAGSSRYVDTISIGGVEGTYIYSETSSANEVTAGLAMRTVASGTTTDIVVTLSGVPTACEITVVILYGVISGTAHDVSAIRGSSTSVIAVLDVPDTGLLVAFTHLADSDNETLNFTNVTERLENAGGGVNWGMGYTLRLASQSNRNVTADWGVANGKMLVAATFL